MKEIIQLDLAMVDKSTFCVFNLDPTKRMFGSIHELISCEINRKPVFIVCEAGLDKVNNWAFGLLEQEAFFTSFNDLKEHLRFVAFAPDNEIRGKISNRWRFFNLEPQILQIVRQTNAVIPIEEYERLLEKEIMLCELMDAGRALP